MGRGAIIAALAGLAVCAMMLRAQDWSAPAPPPAVSGGGGVGGIGGGVGGGESAGPTRSGRPSGAVVSREKSFSIPFRVDPLERNRLQEVQLYYSTDRGASWRAYSAAGPDQEFFPFTARADGEYWFTVRTLDRERRYYPATMAGIAPGLQVLVDTTPPEVALRALAPQGDQIGIEWDIVDENLDLRTLRAEFAAKGTQPWYQVPIEAKAAGRAVWKPGVRGPIDIRLRVLDRAGNEGMKVVSVAGVTGISAGEPLAKRGRPSPNDDAYPPDGDLVPAEPQSVRRRNPGNQTKPQPPGPVEDGINGDETDVWQRPTQGRVVPPGGGATSPARSAPRRTSSPPNTKLVNSTRFAINYGVEEVGKSGLSAVSLYYTLDGRTWSYYGDDDDKQSPFYVEVTGEGIYGFSIVAKSGVGVGDDPPATGDPPQIWVEVDITPPKIELLPPHAGNGAATGVLNIAWKAQDRNLAPKAISLFHAENSNGPWLPIKTGIENTGTFQWAMPKDAPYKFFVRIEARDRAGNAGRAETDHPVVVDLARPRTVIKDVAPNSDPPPALKP